MAGASSGSTRPHPVVLAAAACAAFAAWTSSGALAVTDPTRATPRLGILPSPWLLAVLLAAGVLLLRRFRPQDALPLLLTSLLLLPWLPCPLPAAAAIWTGPLGSWVWIVAALGVVASIRPPLACGPFADPRRAPILAGLLGLGLYAAGARAISGVAPTGDEPHYLILTQSLLYDGDLRIENNHARRDYEEYYPADLRPHSQRLGRDGQIYSIHAPGLPFLMVPAFAAGGRAGAVLFIAALAALQGALLWRLAHRLSGDPGAAWFGWACGALTVAPFFQAITVFPDAAGALVVVSGLYVLVGEELGDETSLRGLALHGLALATLPWLHSRFAPLAGVLGACILLRLLRSASPTRRIAAFVAAPVVGAALWLGFFAFIYGTPSPSAPYAMDAFNPANMIRGFPGLLFDRRSGLLPHAPVMAFALAGLWPLGREHRRLALELLLLIAIYLGVVSGFGIWWGGASAPARLTAPVLPCLGLLAAVLWARAPGASSRAWGALLLAVSLPATALLARASDGELLQSDRAGRAGLLAFVSETADLSLAVPSYVTEPLLTAACRTAVWLCLALLAVWAVERRARLGMSRGALALLTSGTLALLVMTAETLATAGHVPLSTTRSELRLIQAFDPAAGQLRVVLPPPERLGAGAMLGRIRLGDDGERAGPLSLEGVPAGRYRLSLEPAPAQGRLRVRCGRSRRPLLDEPVSPGGGTALDLPVDVARLSIAVEDAGDANASRVVVAPAEIVRPRDRPSRRAALGAAGYDAGAVFSLDPGVDLEREGFWVSAGVTNEVVIRPRDPAGPATLLLRNAPVTNQVRLERGAWRFERELSASEETLVALPPAAGVLRITTTSGFRPQGDAARPRGRRGGRFLGAWLAVR